MSGMMVLLWSGLILLAIWAIRSFSSPKPPGDPAMDVLRRRLAAEAINQEGVSADC
jgi:hypothetical protein